jgi:hypothetical protein
LYQYNLKESATAQKSLDGASSATIFTTHGRRLRFRLVKSSKTGIKRARIAYWLQAFIIKPELDIAIHKMPLNHPSLLIQLLF